jgi:UDP-2,4-diacetamido-2,4,6-trideoxy-beta-L-altropyranose hydrolase
MMKVLVRCDASAVIGSGHVMRCLTLADFLSSRGARISFVCRELPGDLTHLIEGKGYPVHRITLKTPGWEEDAEKSAVFATEAGMGFEWLIVDHYRLDARYERRMRRLGVKILAIDDLADRPHDCDLLLDQNLHKNMELRYQGLLPAHCLPLLGPQYALLRPEFFEARLKLRPRRGELKRILVSFGGADPTNETAKVMAALELLETGSPALDVVVGSANLDAASVQAACAARKEWSFHNQVDNMAELMSRADLALGGGGGTTWERCFLGLPSLTVVVADNQREPTEAVAEKGATWNLGWHSDVTPQLMAQWIDRLQKDPELLAEASRRCFQLMGDRAPTAGHPLVALMHGDKP